MTAETATESILAAVEQRDAQRQQDYEERVETYLGMLLRTIRGEPNFRPDMVALAAEQLGFSKADVELHINLLTTQGEH